MKDLSSSRAADKGRTTRELAATLRSTLDRKYGQVLRNAQSRWEEKFAGKDPSDACVSVRVAPRGASTRGYSASRAA